MKKIILFLVFSISIQAGYSQKDEQNIKDKQEKQDSAKKDTKESQHEITGWLSGGFSSLQYSPAVGKFTPGYGGDIGIGYTYLFKPKWGISTGLELAVYNAKTSINGHFDSYSAIDDEDQYNEMILLANIDHFTEKQQVYYLNIPLMFQYQAKKGNGNKFYAALGGKLGIPVKGKYQSTGDYLTKGEYHFTTDIFENMPEHGFNFYDDLTAKENLKFDLNIQLSAEVGYKWRLSDNWYLYSGLYCDYGLSDVRKEKNDPYHLLQYNRDNPVKYIINSMAESYYNSDSGTQDYLKRMNTISIGIKIKAAFKMD